MLVNLADPVEKEVLHAQRAQRDLRYRTSREMRSVRMTSKRGRTKRPRLAPLSLSEKSFTAWLLNVSASAVAHVLHASG